MPQKPQCLKEWIAEQDWSQEQKEEYWRDFLELVTATNQKQKLSKYSYLSAA
jgi:hypothetical protein